jgi:hypothetical protein
MRPLGLRSRDRSTIQFVADESASAEARYLLSCIRRELDCDAICTARKMAARRSFDWDRFKSLVTDHAIVPYIYARLSEDESWGAPQRLLQEMGRECRAMAFRNLQLVSELVRLDKLLTEAGVQAIWFKGPILASQAYGNVAMRQFADLDLLIPRARAREVFGILQKQDYAAGYDILSVEKWPLLQRVSSAQSFGDERRQIFLDVHWSLTDADYSFSKHTAMITREIELAGRTILTFGAESMLSYLCYHGCKHDWESLRCILDVAEFVRFNRDLAWNELISRTPPIGTSRMVKLGLTLAHLAARVQFPENVREWMERDRKVCSLASAILERRLRSHAQLGSHVYLAAMESRTDRMRLLANIIFKPSAIEIERITLSEKLFFVYSLLRFERVFRKHVVKRIEAFLDPSPRA